MKKIILKGLNSSATTGSTTVYFEIIEELESYTKTTDVLELELDGVYTFENQDLVLNKISEILNQEGFDVESHSYTATPEELQKVFIFKDINPASNFVQPINQ